MKTKVLDFFKDEYSKILSESIKLIKNNGVVLFPTDTVYGLSCDYESIIGKERIYEIKQRPKEKRFIVLIRNFEELLRLSLDKIDKKILSILPAPITLIIKNRYSKSNEDNTLAVRFPDDKFLLEVMNVGNFNLISTSANISNNENITQIDKIIDTFKNKVDLIVRRGDITSNPYKILRQGKYKLEWIK